jgi:hypothetical protein
MTKIGNKIGAVPSLLFTLGTVTFTFAFAPIASAQAPAAKPAAPAAASAKPAAMPAPASKPVAATAPAAAPAAPAMPTPAKELEAFMKGFEGSWKCDTKFAAGSMGPGSPEVSTKTTVKIKKEFDGFSWHGEFKLAKTGNMPATSGVFQVGYDPGTKQATYLSYDSMGSAMMGAGPISGDSATFTEEGFMMGMKAKVRETMSKKGSKEIGHKLEMDQGKGYQLVAEDTCKK